MSESDHLGNAQAPFTLDPKAIEAAASAARESSIMDEEWDWKVLTEAAIQAYLVAAEAKLDTAGREQRIRFPWRSKER